MDMLGAGRSLVHSRRRSREKTVLNLRNVTKLVSFRKRGCLFDRLPRASIHTQCSMCCNSVCLSVSARYLLLMSAYGIISSETRRVRRGSCNGLTDANSVQNRLLWQFSRLFYLASSQRTILGEPRVNGIWALFTCQVMSHRKGSEVAVSCELCSKQRSTVDALNMGSKPTARAKEGFPCFLLATT